MLANDDLLKGEEGKNLALSKASRSFSVSKKNKCEAFVVPGTVSAETALKAPSFIAIIGVVQAERWD
jgi:hypothetical protein